MKAKLHDKLFYKNEQPTEKFNFKLAKFQDFVKYANFFYATIGIQPYDDLELKTKDKSFITNLIFYIQIINMNIIMSGEVAFAVAAFITGEHYIEATYAMSYVGFVIVSNCKMLFIWQQKPILTKLVKGLKDIFPEHKDLQRDYSLQKYLKQFSYITLSFSVLYMILIWTYNLMAIIKYIVGDLIMGLPDIEQGLPFIVLIPWNWQHHWSYYPVYVFHILAGYTSAGGQISSDLFLIACATQLIMHFDYLAKKITNYAFTDCTATDMEFLKVAVHFHANLLELCDQLNHVFGVPLFLNFISSAFVICFVGFQITLGASPETMVKLFLFFVSSTAQVYLICHFGQHLLDISSSVANAVYNHNWFWSNARYQKMLVLMVHRAQKPAQLKATTFICVSLDTFAELMQTSYKFFTLLRTMFQ